jgi:dolichyl-phosphate beta-glucosyltransferase
VVIVNDGSKDGTAAVAMGYVRREGADRVRLLNLFRNSGKGAAVRKGALRARGQFVLMADADGATQFADVDALLDRVGRIVTPAGEGVAIGSRAHLGGGDGSVKRSPLRRLLMWGFHTYMSLAVGGAGIADTQCGFKLFTRPSARRLFDALHIERWAFDVELVYLAARLGMPMTVRLQHARVVVGRTGELLGGEGRWFGMAHTPCTPASPPPSPCHTHAPPHLLLPRPPRRRCP